MMDHIRIEIRSAEGGLDSKLFVSEQMDIYVKFGRRRGL